MASSLANDDREEEAVGRSGCYSTYVVDARLLSSPLRFIQPHRTQGKGWWADQAPGQVLLNAHLSSPPQNTSCPLSLLILLQGLSRCRSPNFDHCWPSPSPRYAMTLRTERRRRSSYRIVTPPSRHGQITHSALGELRSSTVRMSQAASK